MMNALVRVELPTQLLLNHMAMLRNPSPVHLYLHIAARLLACRSIRHALPTRVNFGLARATVTTESLRRCRTSHEKVAAAMDAYSLAQSLAHGKETRLRAIRPARVLRRDKERPALLTCFLAKATSSRAKLVSVARGHVLFSATLARLCKAASVGAVMLLVTVLSILAGTLTTPSKLKFVCHASSYG